MIQLPATAATTAAAANVAAATAALLLVVCAKPGRLPGIDKKQCSVAIYPQGTSQAFEDALELGRAVGEARWSEGEVPIQLLYLQVTCGVLDGCNVP